MSYPQDSDLSALEALRHCCSREREQALALPVSSYRDSAVMKRERDTLFTSQWLFACPREKLTAPGSYFATVIAGEPVAVIHGADGQLRALSNSCRHRGTPLLDEGFGRIEKNISCPYHAWTYRSDGSFVGAPMCGNVNLDDSHTALPSFAVEVFLGLVFINFDSAAVAMAERFATVAQYAELFEPARFVHSHVDAAERWHCNWKIAFENAAESYHLFKVHKETLETVSPSKGAFYVAGSSAFCLTGGAYQLPTMDKLWLSGSPEIYKHYLLIALPPSVVMVLSYDSLGWIAIDPHSPEHCRIGAGFISAKKARSAKDREQSFTQAFFDEDKSICERVQRAAHSRVAPCGQLVEMEAVLADFHSFLNSQLFGAAETSLRVNNSEQNVFN